MYCDNCIDMVGQYCYDCADKESQRMQDEAFKRGAEKMREEIALLFDGSEGIPGLAKMPAWRDFIRNLPVPSDK